MEERPRTSQRHWAPTTGVGLLCLVNPIVFVGACAASVGLSGEEYAVAGTTSTALYEKWSYRFVDPEVGQTLVGSTRQVNAVGESYRAPVQGVVRAVDDDGIEIDGWAGADSVAVPYRGPVDQGDVKGRVIGDIESPDSAGDALAIALLVGIPVLFISLWVTFYVLAEWTRSQSRAPTGWWWLTFFTWGPGLVLYRRRR